MRLAMSETLLETANVVDKEFQVISWRREQLVRAGYAAADATALAFESAVDLHAAVELRLRGCPSSTAAKILL
jgi:hypothetical protein